MQSMPNSEVVVDSSHVGFGNLERFMFGKRRMSLYTSSCHWPPIKGLFINQENATAVIFTILT